MIRSLLAVVMVVAVWTVLLLAAVWLFDIKEWPAL